MEDGVEGSIISFLFCFWVLDPYVINELPWMIFSCSRCCCRGRSPFPPWMEALRHRPTPPPACPTNKALEVSMCDLNQRRKTKKTKKNQMPWNLFCHLACWKVIAVIFVFIFAAATAVTTNLTTQESTMVPALATAISMAPSEVAVMGKCRKHLNNTRDKWYFHWLVLIYWYFTVLIGLYKKNFFAF